MNVSLRAIHDALHVSGDATTTWRRFAAEVERRTSGGAPIRPHDLETIARELAVPGSAMEWLHNLRTLGVIGTGNSWSSARADNVATALDLVADSFATVGPTVAWAVVATLPIEIREHLHPPVVRQTAGILLELIDGSTEELLLATPFVDPPAIGKLADSLERPVFSLQSSEEETSTIFSRANAGAATLEVAARAGALNGQRYPTSDEMPFIMALNTSTAWIGAPIAIPPHGSDTYGPAAAILVT